MSDETNLYFNLDDEDNEKRVVVRVSELVRCLKHFRASILCPDDDSYEHHMRDIGGHLWAVSFENAELGSEREKQLERLVNQLWYLVNHRSGYGYAAALEAIEELGIEVDE